MATDDVVQQQEEYERLNREEADRQLRAIRMIREEELEVSYDHVKQKWSVGTDVRGHGDSPAEALFHFNNARKGYRHRAYPGHSFSINELPMFERQRWLTSIYESQVKSYKEKAEQLEALRADGAVRVLDWGDVNFDGLAEDQTILMTVATLREVLDAYRSPAEQKAERERIDAALQGPPQYSGPEPKIGLPRYYRINRRGYETHDGQVKANWFPGAFDPADRESMGFCSYDTPESAAAECRRHAEHVRADATGVELTAAWSASTIEAFWYRWVESSDGDSSKLTIADFVRDLCAEVRK